jgi:hypothetical protein
MQSISGLVQGGCPAGQVGGDGGESSIDMDESDMDMDWAAYNSHKNGLAGSVR